MSAILFEVLSTKVYRDTGAVASFTVHDNRVTMSKKTPSASQESCYYSCRLTVGDEAFEFFVANYQEYAKSVRRALKMVVEEQKLRAGFEVPEADIDVFIERSGMNNEEYKITINSAPFRSFCVSRNELAQAVEHLSSFV